jgi:NTP pyrophosphatase (non-canonical NTP hydrolase)
MGKTLDQMQSEIGQWGDSVFPKRTSVSVAAHFEEEAGEFMAALRSGEREQAEEELADCFILLMQFAHVSGLRLSEVAERKMTVNRARTWRSEPEPAGHTKHVEAAS